MHITCNMYTIRVCISHFQSFRNEASNFSKDNLKSTLFLDDVIIKSPNYDVTSSILNIRYHEHHRLSSCLFFLKWV